MVERYLQGRLTADEEQAFEEAYLSDPGLLDELVLTERLQQGLRRHTASDDARRDAAADAGHGKRWLRAFGSVPYAAAATVLLGLSVAFSTALLVQNRNLEAVQGPAAGAAPTRLVPLVTVRGDGANRVEAPPSGEWAVLLVDAGFTQYDAYRATLIRAAEGSEEQVTRLEGLSPTYDGRIGVGLPGDVLTPGDYELRLEGRLSGPDGGFEPITRTPLTVTAP